MPARSAKTKSAEGGGTISEDKTRLVAKLVKENAIILYAKLYDYTLDKTHQDGGPKAAIFDSVLGYNTSNAEEFRFVLLDGLDNADKQYKRTNAQDEDIFAAIMHIKGPTGRVAKVVTAWKNTPEKRERFSLVSAYIKD
jgi:hypothetical protein